MTTLELYMYYIQHIFAAIMAPMVLFWSGRYTARDYMAFPMPLFGFVLFAIYMRFFLTPLSAMTWANLNHSLCGIDNDPWRAQFGMHKYFFFWSDGYLLLGSFTISTMNGHIGKYLWKHEDVKTRRD